MSAKIDKLPYNPATATTLAFIYRLIVEWAEQLASWLREPLAVVVHPLQYRDTVNGIYRATVQNRRFTNARLLLFCESYADGGDDALQLTVEYFEPVSGMFCVVPNYEFNIGSAYGVPGQGPHIYQLSNLPEAFQVSIKHDNEVSGKYSVTVFFEPE